MKKFETPVIEMFAFAVADVVATSEGGSLGENELPGKPRAGGADPSSPAGNLFA